MAKVIFHDTEEVVEIEDNSPLGDLMEQHGVFRACSQGICGTCVIEIVDGKENLSPPTSEEIAFLGEEGVQSERLACQCSILSGTIRVKT